MHTCGSQGTIAGLGASGLADHGSQESKELSGLHGEHFHLNPLASPASSLS